MSVVKWTVDMIAWISPKSQIPKIICRMTPFNSTSKACLLFVYAFKHLFTIHVYFNICPLLPFFASYKSTNYISRLSSQNETNLFIETNFWPIQGMHYDYDPSQDPAMSIGQDCEVLKLKTYLLALTGQVRMNCGSLASPSTKTIIPSSSLTSWSRRSQRSRTRIPNWAGACADAGCGVIVRPLLCLDDSINWNQHETNQRVLVGIRFPSKMGGIQVMYLKHSQGFSQSNTDQMEAPVGFLLWTQPPLRFPYGDRIPGAPLVKGGAAFGLGEWFSVSLLGWFTQDQRCNLSTATVWIWSNTMDNVCLIVSLYSLFYYSISLSDGLIVWLFACLFDSDTSVATVPTKYPLGLFWW